jgi:hypothetical protein
MMIWPFPDEPFDRAYRRTPSEALDARLAWRVVETLAADSRVRRQDVTVEVQNGVVMLTGAVDGSRVRAAVADAARGVPGVRDVCNVLRIKEGGSPVRDAEFDEAALVREPDDAFGEIAARLAADDPVGAEMGGRPRGAISTAVLVCLLTVIVVLLAALLGMFGSPAVAIGCGVAAVVVERRLSRRGTRGKRRDG